MTNWIEYLEVNSKYSSESDVGKRKVLEFIFLWLKVNEYYNQEYTNINKDKNKFLELKENLKIQNKYKQNSNKFLTEFATINYDRQPNYYVINMQHPDTKVYYYKPNKIGLEDLLKVIYQIRCNLFHGEKEPSGRDLDLISWAYDCLSILTQDVIF